MTFRKSTEPRTLSRKTWSSKALAALGAAALAVQPQLAAAQASCIAEEEVSAIAIYAVPGIVRSMQLTCGAQLAADGFLAREGAAFAGRYAALQSRVWPTAKGALIRYLGAGGNSQTTQSLSFLAALPDENVRPLVDALIVQEVSPHIAAGDCGRIERVLEVIAPVEPEVAGALIGVAASLFAPEDPPICPAGRA